MAAGRGDIHVDADHQIEVRERRIEPAAVGNRQHRVAGHGNEDAHLAAARCGNFLGHRHGGEFPQHLGVPRNPAVKTPAASRPGLADNIDSGG